MFRALLHFCVLAIALGPVSAQVYKWVDDNGVTHYGERPPQGRKSTEVPYRLGTPAPIANPASPPMANPASPEESAKQAPSKPQERPPEDLTKRREQCVRQRELLAKMRRTPPKYELNERGERVLADSGERDAAITKQEQAVLAACGG